MKNVTVYNFMIFPPNQMAKVCSKNNSMRQLIFLPSGGSSLKCGYESNFHVDDDRSFYDSEPNKFKKAGGSQYHSHKYLPISKEMELS